MADAKIRYSLNFKTVTDEEKDAFLAKLDQMGIEHRKSKWWVNFWHTWLTSEELLVIKLTFDTLTINVSTNQFDAVVEDTDAVTG